MIFVVIAIFFQLVLGGLGNVAHKQIAMAAHPLFALAIRCFLAGPVLFITSLFRDKKDFKILAKESTAIIKGALFRTLIPSSLCYWALQYVSATKFALFYNFSPFITCILSYFLLRETITPKKLLGISVAFLGIIPILMAKNTLELSLLIEMLYMSWPEVALFGSVLSLNYGWVEMKRFIIRYPHISVSLVRSYEITLSGIFAFIVSYATNHVGIYATSIKQFFFWTSLSTFCILVVANTLNAWLLKRLSPTLLSLGSFSLPLFTALFSWILLDQPIGWETLVSTLLVLIGFGIFYRADNKEKTAH